VCHPHFLKFFPAAPFTAFAGRAKAAKETTYLYEEAPVHARKKCKTITNAP
jgi:hypothetical protein